MKNIDIKKIKEIKEELEEVERFGDVMYISENGKPKYALLNYEYYDELETYKQIYKNSKGETPNLKIITDSNNEISYEEYESLKLALNEIFDKTFKPKPEKLN